MSKSVNRVFLLGHAGKDPEILDLRSGTKANLSLATNEPFRDGRGDWHERTEWHNLVGYQRIAEIFRDYVRKGSQIFIQGSLRTRTWEDAETGQKRYRTEIVVLDVSLLSAPPADPRYNGSVPHLNGNGHATSVQYEEPSITRDEIPF